MAKIVEFKKTKERFTPTQQQLDDVAAFLSIEIEDAFSSRHALEATWRENLRQYEGQPNGEVQNFPIENAPNVEVTLGAIASDSIYAQAVDLIYSVRPLVTVRGVPKKKGDLETSANVKALQRWINWMSENESNIRTTGDEAILDDVMLGTGVFYVPWVKKIKKTRISKVVSQGPRIRTLPLEDFLVPGGTNSELDELPWVGLRFWKTEQEITQDAKVNKWDLGEDNNNIAPAGAKDWVRNRREMLGRHVEGVQRKGNLYEIFDVYLHFDIDGDGINEDLYAVFDRTSQKVLKLSYCPYDRRPVEAFVYQRRAHMFYGLGVLQMMGPYQEELTDLHNYQILNVLLANCRFWIGKEGRIPSNMKLYPNKVITTMEPREDLIAEQMGEVYPSLNIVQQQIVQLAERRVGVNELTPRPSATLGTRTPGITAMSMLQQVNKRFTPAFSGIRDGFAAALRQCLYRYQEQLLSGNLEVAAHIRRVLGLEDGSRVINILKQDSFDEHMSMELTASDASVNKEADRQNALMLSNLLSQYYEKTLNLVTIAVNPQTPPEVKAVAKRVAESASEIIDRTIRTFDQIRDPALFIIDVNDEMDAGAAGAPQNALQQLIGSMGAEGGGGPMPTGTPIEEGTV